MAVRSCGSSSASASHIPTFLTGSPPCSGSLDDFRSFAGHPLDAIDQRMAIQLAVSQIGFFDLKRENSFPPG